jgi:succinylglutamate desuccinylase
MLRLTLVAVLLIVLAVPAAALAVTRYGDRGVNRLNGGRTRTGSTASAGTTA